MNPRSPPPGGVHPMVACCFGSPTISGPRNIHGSPAQGSDFGLDWLNHLFCRTVNREPKVVQVFTTWQAAFGQARPRGAPMVSVALLKGPN
jgi:hypothetical protein